MLTRSLVFWTTLLLVAAAVFVGLTSPSGAVSAWIKIVAGVLLVLGAALIFFSAEGARKRRTQVAALALGAYGVAQFIPDSRFSLALVIPAAFLIWMTVFGVPRRFFTPSAAQSK